MSGQPINPSSLYGQGRSAAASIRKQSFSHLRRKIANTCHRVIFPRETCSSGLGTASVIVSGTPRVPELTGLAKLPMYIALRDRCCSKKMPPRLGYPQATLIASCSGLTMCSKLMILTGFPRLDLSSNLAISSALEQTGKLISSHESKIMPDPRHKSSR